MGVRLLYYAPRMVGWFPSPHRGARSYPRPVGVARRDALWVGFAFVVLWGAFCGCMYKKCCKWCGCGKNVVFLHEYAFIGCN